MDKFEDLPESWQKEIKSLRSEAADYRVKYQEAKGRQETYDQALAEANTRFDDLTAKAGKATDDYEAALTAQESLTLENLRYKAAIGAGIPQYADRLRGSSLEELTADAQEFSQSVGKVRLPKDVAASAPSNPPPVDALERALTQALGLSDSNDD